MIDLRKSADIWIARLKRANKANALRPEMLKDTHSIASNAHEARALFLTGTGTVFSAVVPILTLLKMVWQPWIPGKRLQMLLRSYQVLQ